MKHSDRFSRSRLCNSRHFESESTKVVPNSSLFTPSIPRGICEGLFHSLARLFPLEKRSLSETVVSMARCIPTHHFTVLMRQQE